MTVQSKSPVDPSESDLFSLGPEAEGSAYAMRDERVEFDAHDDEVDDILFGSEINLDFQAVADMIATANQTTDSVAHVVTDGPLTRAIDLFDSMSGLEDDINEMLRDLGIKPQQTTVIDQAGNNVKLPSLEEYDELSVGNPTLDQVDALMAFDEFYEGDPTIPLWRVLENSQLDVGLIKDEAKDLKDKDTWDDGIIMYLESLEYHGREAAGTIRMLRNAVYNPFHDEITPSDISDVLGTTDPLSFIESDLETLKHTRSSLRTLKAALTLAKRIHGLDLRKSVERIKAYASEFRYRKQAYLRAKQVAAAYNAVVVPMAESVLSWVNGSTGIERTFPKLSNIRLIAAQVVAKRIARIQLVFIDIMRSIKEEEDARRKTVKKSVEIQEVDKHIAQLDQAIAIIDLVLNAGVDGKYAARQLLKKAGKPKLGGVFD